MNDILRLLDERRKKLALLDHLRWAFLAYQTTQTQVDELNGTILTEMKAQFCSPTQEQTLLEEKKKAAEGQVSKETLAPTTVGQLSTPDGINVILQAALQKNPTLRAGENEIRTFLKERGNVTALFAIEEAATKIKENKEKESKNNRKLNFTTIIEDNSPLPEADLSQIDLKGLTKINETFYDYHIIKGLEGLDVRFRYKAEGPGPKNIKRVSGKTGENADMVEGRIKAGNVFLTTEGFLCMRVYNRNYRVTETEDSMPGNKYVPQEGAFPLITYRVDRMVVGSLEKMLGGEWKPVESRA